MKIVPEAYTSFYSFVIPVFLPLCILSVFKHILLVSFVGLCIVSLISSYLIVNILSLFVFQKCSREIIFRASFLGTVFCTGMLIGTYCIHSLSIFGWYICFLSFFHISEYLTIAVTNPKTLSIDSFILNHSVAYGAAAVASWTEFFIEFYYFRAIKEHFFVSIIGVILCTSGEILRKLAMFTASTNFNHIVQTVKENDHVLVTQGIYSLCRHPSYVGWFYWSVGTQLLLVNPVCVVIYAIVSWEFFKHRLLLEEKTLLDFFGKDYVEYKKKVSSGLPFNNGVSLE